jgi:predicted ABC-type ATPase
MLCLRTKPLLILSGGRSASGKTSSIEKEGIKNSGGFYINADEIQERLPGYNGKLAGIFNGEAQDIAIQAERTARRLRLNIIYDATLKSTLPAVDRVKHYIDAGYDVDGYFTHTTPYNSAIRTVQRFRRSGRYVPPAIPFNSRTNEKTFDTIRPMLRRWAIYDNNGKEPKRVAGGHNRRS